MLLLGAERPGDGGACLLMSDTARLQRRSKHEAKIGATIDNIRVTKFWLEIAAIKNCFNKMPQNIARVTRPLTKHLIVKKDK